MSVKFQGTGLRGLVSFIFKVGDIVLGRSLNFRVSFDHI